MNGYYMNYLMSSESYTKLVSAINSVNMQVNKITKLYSVLDGAVGNNIDSMRNDLSNIKTNLNNYSESLKSIKNTLESNARMFDKTLNTWKGRIGKDYSKPITNELISSDLQNEKYVFLSSSEKITDVLVDENGYVNVKTKEVVTHTIDDKKNDKKTKNVVKEEYYSYKEEFGAESRSGWWNQAM